MSTEEHYPKMALALKSTGSSAFADLRSKPASSHPHLTSYLASQFKPSFKVLWDRNCDHLGLMSAPRNMPVRTKHQSNISLQDWSTHHTQELCKLEWCIYLWLELVLVKWRLASSLFSNRRVYEARAQIGLFHRRRVLVGYIEKPCSAVDELVPDGGDQYKT